MAEQKVILAIDAGTTGVTALLVSESGAILARGYQEFNQHFVQPGWVEHIAEDIWQATLSATKQALIGSTQQPSAIGITNQRETIVVWHRETLVSPRPAIVWQDRRSTALVEELRNDGLESLIRDKTGLGLDPYFSSSKYLWLAHNEPELWAAVEAGEYYLGTVDSYLISRLSAGVSHITDASNASRTQLFNIETLNWDDELLNLFKVPRHSLPKVVPSFGMLAQTSAEAFLGIDAPITAIAGDQQAALFGQLGLQVGDTKCTYGTGAFILQNTGSARVRSRNGLLSTIAWRAPDGEVTYALEGSVFVAGAAVQWLRDGLGIIKQASEIEPLAASVESSDGVYFVPALTGLAAPHWAPDVRGTLVGITRGTTRAHIARATLEAIAFQIREVMDVFETDTGIACTSLRVDGGAAANNLLMQLQADVMRVNVERLENLESTAYGIALMAGLGVGIWESQQDLAGLVKIDRRFEAHEFDQAHYKKWLRTVTLAIDWTEN